MKSTTLTMLTIAMLSVALGASAATESDYQASYAAASALSTKALKMNAAWTVTEGALKQAKAAAGARDYDKAVALAKNAEALAQASIRQAEEQQTAWQKAVVK